MNKFLSLLLASGLWLLTSDICSAQLTTRPATQAEVNAGTLSTAFVSPKTLANASIIPTPAGAMLATNGTAQNPTLVNPTVIGGNVVTTNQIPNYQPATLIFNCINANGNVDIYSSASPLSGFSKLNTAPLLNQYPSLDSFDCSFVDGGAVKCLTLSSNGYAVGAVPVTNLFVVTTPDMVNWTGNLARFPNFLTLISPLSNSNRLWTPKIFTNAVSGGYGVVVEINTNWNADGGNFTPYYSFFTDSTFTNLSNLTALSTTGADLRRLYNQEIYPVGTNNLMLADDLNGNLQMLSCATEFGAYKLLTATNTDVFRFGTKFENFNLVHQATNQWVIYGSLYPAGGYYYSTNYSGDAAFAANPTNGWSPLKTFFASGPQYSGWVAPINNVSTLATISAQSQAFTANAIQAFSQNANITTANITTANVTNLNVGSIYSDSAFASSVNALNYYSSPASIDSISGLYWAWQVNDNALEDDGVVGESGISKNSGSTYSTAESSGGASDSGAGQVMLDNHVFIEENFSSSFIVGNQFVWETNSPVASNLDETFYGTNGYSTEYEADYVKARVGFIGSFSPSAISSGNLPLNVTNTAPVASSLLTGNLNGNVLTTTATNRLVFSSVSSFTNTLGREATAIVTAGTSVALQDTNGVSIATVGTVATLDVLIPMHVNMRIAGTGVSAILY